MKYPHSDIEKKWQKRWETEGVYRASDDPKKEKFYTLVEFPYPSGAGLHVGHPRSYTALDIVSRKRRMEGKNVLFPMGWDAFGLPTENYAIKTGRPPAEITKENIDTFRRQLQSIGFSFDWSREVDTTDPAYYKWTQWMFIQFFKAGLCYKAKMAINWCPKDKIGLANEEVVGGVCERCGGPVEKREKEQWMIAITKYADRLLSDLDTVDYLPKIKKQQADWIGRSEGAEVEFAVEGVGSRGVASKVTVFTTRPDTLFGATYLVLAPEHPLVATIVTAEQRGVVDAYVAATQKKTEMERGDETKEKTGIFTGAYAINPANKERIPVWVADYVLFGYGTSAIMAVPAHDKRDFAFAKKFGLEVRVVVEAGESVEPPFVAEGTMVRSEFLDGIGSDFAKEKMISWLESQGVGRKKVTYRLRDWVFSRQRYWGEPIPLVHCENGCAKEQGGWLPVADEQLPVVLPIVEKYQPTDNGESPLATMADWVTTTCPNCGGVAHRETDTMPNWAGSSWYFLRYIDPKNDTEFASREKLKYWMPIDLYNGGMEHTTLHLLYSRFWNKVLFDLGFVPTAEPYARRHSHGLIMAEDGAKMSKSKGNVVNPDDIVKEFGADTLRVYEMFMGPFEEPVPWSTNGVVGVRRFLDKIHGLVTECGGTGVEEYVATEKLLHKTIKKITEDIEGFHFNTAVSALMIFVNAWAEHGASKETIETFLKILSPFAPHLAEECWATLGHTTCVVREPWPAYDSALIKDAEVTVAVQVNGKLRGTIVVAPDADEAFAVAAARADENVRKYLGDGKMKKVVYIPGRMVNFVIQS
jgi:leucyl-tRNA synthetase